MNRSEIVLRNELVLLRRLLDGHEAALSEKEREIEALKADFAEKTSIHAGIEDGLEKELAELREGVRLWRLAKDRLCELTRKDYYVDDYTHIKSVLKEDENALRASIGTKKEDPYSPKNVLKNRLYTLLAPLNCPYCHAVDRGDDTCQQCGRDLRAAAEKEEQ